MNTHGADQLDKLLETELKALAPITVLSKRLLAVNNFTIKQNKNRMWELSRIKSNTLDSFYFKTCALIAQKMHSTSNFKLYADLKILDTEYFKYSSDAARYQQQYQTTTNSELRDIFISKYSYARDKAVYAKRQILSKFKTAFR